MDIEKAIKTKKKLPLPKRVLINMTMVSCAVDTRFGEVLKPFGLSLQQFNVLRILKGQQGKAINLRDIQSRMVHKMSNTTRLVDKLVTKALAERKICPDNRRKVEITLTPAGKKLLDQVDKEMDRAEKGLVRKFSAEELEQLDHLLNQLQV